MEHDFIATFTQKLWKSAYIKSPNEFLNTKDTKPHLQCCRPPPRSFSVEVVFQSVQEENMKLTPNGACKGPKQF